MSSDLYSMQQRTRGDTRRCILNGRRKTGISRWHFWWRWAIVRTRLHFCFNFGHNFITTFAFAKFCQTIFNSHFMEPIVICATKLKLYQLAHVWDKDSIPGHFGADIQGNLLTEGLGTEFFCGNVHLFNSIYWSPIMCQRMQTQPRRRHFPSQSSQSRERKISI